MHKKTLFLATFLALAPLVSFASFDRNLKYEMSGNDVSDLQDILIESNCLNHSSTGYFGLLTLNAVECWQTQNSLPSTGYFGVLSRGLANMVVSNAVASSTKAEIEETGTTTPVVVNHHNWQINTNSQPTQPTQPVTPPPANINQDIPVQVQIFPTATSTLVSQIACHSQDATTNFGSEIGSFNITGLTSNKVVSKIDYTSSIDNGKITGIDLETSWGSEISLEHNDSKGYSAESVYLSNGTVRINLYADLNGTIPNISLTINSIQFTDGTSLQGMPISFNNVTFAFCQ